ncbi:histidine ammonia-lyase [Brevibacterium aurantiacum]|uniref:Histidine ammonia-lyase n=1 Tax=Brevibacterium aurantiacum TaxID=273384 RepID=A0A556C606_BREAU|nr:histidine ammonia-lyase [Brevibacterium aurantiacum]TSI12872.1 histidine ammonia-lyase [Brevibacterium aurantiacum]
MSFRAKEHEINTQEYVTISPSGFNVDDLHRIARDRCLVRLSDDARRGIRESRRVVDDLLSQDAIVYGITTGVGDNSKIRISPEESAQLQLSLVRSHASGVGDLLSAVETRAVMTMMVRNLSLGYSGIREEVVDLLLGMVNEDVIPRVPRKGSLGYLSYQAHIALVLIGEGEACVDGSAVSGAEALKRRGLRTVVLQAKEGLSLLNGTCDMVALGGLAVHDALSLLKTADIASAVSVEGLRGNVSAFDARIGAVKKHEGVGATAENLRTLLQGSSLEEDSQRKVQDALSLRSIPQVHGAAKDMIRFVKSVIEDEMNSATDNPLIFAEDEMSLSSSNCHGESVAMALDMLAIALTELSSISERRTFRLTSAHHSGLPPFLSPNPGTDSGYMIPQYTAAALVSDNKRLAQPASVDSIPSAAGQEDHVSMGTSSALKSLEIIENVSHVLAIEFLCACQAVEFISSEPIGRGVSAAHDTVRAVVPKLERDRQVHKDIESIHSLIVGEELITAVESGGSKLRTV